MADDTAGDQAPQRRDATPGRGLPRAVRRLLRLLLGTGIVLAVLGLIAVAYFTWAGVIGDNLRVVDPGRYYRSGRMDGDDLRRTIERNGIKRVVNLCGKEHDKEWYDQELAVCSELGVVQEDLRVGSRDLPKRKVVRRLITIFDEGPYPMLVHCGGGADRAGFAAALYEVLKMGRNPELASDEQLSWRYGHLPVGGHGELDRFFELYAEQPEGTDFRTWALTRYDDDD